VWLDLAAPVENYLSHFSPFKRDIAHIVEGKTLIISTCTRCHESKALSKYDGSLERWECEHECDVDSD